MIKRLMKVLRYKTKQRIIISLLIIIITLMHYLTGALDSPEHGFYKLLYFIPIILSSFNFGYKGGIASSIVIGLIYSPQLLLTVGFGTRAVNELLDIILFFTVGIITGILVEKKNASLHRLDSELKRYSLLESYTTGIIESIRGGIIAVNSDFLITSINHGAKTILDFHGACIGENIFEVSPCFEEIKDKVLDSLYMSQIFENIEQKLKIGDAEFILNISIFPLNFENISKGIVIIIEDISQFKKLQQQVIRNDRLAALGELSTGIAHEIRNPLAVIKIIAQTMKKELKDNQEYVKELEVINEEVESANRVVKGLMEFGKPSKNQKEVYSSNTIIDDVLVIINKYIVSHNVEMFFQAGEDIAILIDKEQIKQAFINIIFNAVDAMPGGGKLAITTEKYDNKWVKIKFEDSGTGIEDKNIDRIFNPFFTTRDQGTGLGLAIVHRIIEEHSGIINVSSKLGEGTRFEILFPIDKER